MVLSKPKQVGEGQEREEKKTKKTKKIKIVQMSSYPTCNRKFQKIAKEIKKTKNHILATSLTKISWERPRKRENKKNRSDEFVPDP